MMPFKIQQYQRGQVLPLFAICILVLFGFAALAVDVGYQRYEQRIQQSATDSAAIAAANEVLYPIAADITSAAKADSASNGFTNDDVNTIVTVNRPPSTGNYSANTNAVEVILKVKHSLFFENLFGNSFAWQATRAVGLVAPGNGNCLYALSPSASLNMNSANIQAVHCGIISNGNMAGNPQTIINAAFIGSVGDATGMKGTYPQAQPGKSLAASDPCPTIPGCAALAALTPQSGPCLTPSGSTLYPGVYCGGLDIGGYTMQPGLYTVYGGITSKGTTTGTGVTIYNVDGGAQMVHSSTTISAPTSGSYAGVVYYQPPSNTNTVKFQNTTNNIDGVMYLPTGYLFSQNADSDYLYIITGDAKFQNANFTMPTSSYTGQMHASLAE